MPYKATATASATATATATSSLKRTYRGYSNSFALGNATATAEDDVSYENALNKANDLAIIKATEDAEFNALAIAQYKANYFFSRVSNNILDDDINVSSTSNSDTNTELFKSVSSTSTSSADVTYPWQYGLIKGYILWGGNFTGSTTPLTQYYYTSTSAPQQRDPPISNNVAGSGTFTYSNCIVPSNLGINCVILFSGYSNFTAASTYGLTNYTNNKNLYTQAYSYLSSTGQPYLISLSLGGGNANGNWDVGKSGAIYSIYEAVTKKGFGFSYTETGTGQILSGTGTGKLDNTYNSLFFDIENCSYGNGSSSKDFINLFNYIKTDGRSTFVDSNTYTQLYEMIIIVSMAHSCSNMSGGETYAKSLFSEIYSDSTGSYDYLCPQLYTQNVGSTNEYAANANILWTGTDQQYGSFASNVKLNQKYLQYGLKMILPAINFYNLYNTGGTNEGNSPNLYLYQTSSSSTTPVTESASGWRDIPYNTDNGTISFFNSIFETTIYQPELGGYAQWVDGTLSTK